MSKVTAEQQAAWSDIVTKKYSDQAIWFLNGFWEECESHAEEVWKWVELFAELDQDKKGDGCELDEFWSHKFLESLGETMTVIEMREKFRTIDVDFNKRMSLTEFLAYRFKKSIQAVIDAPQGDNKEEIEAAQAAVEAAQKAVDDMVERLGEATRTAEAAEAAAAEAKRTADAATAAEEAATQKEAESNAKAAEAQAASDAAEAAAAPYRAAVAENEKALEELHAQEKAYQDKKAALEKTKNDMSIGVVKRNKAANELDQLLGEDPLPLRKAKINQEATVRKMEKAAKPFNEASAKAKAAAEVAEAAAAEATAAVNHARAEREKAEAAKNDADAKAAAAEEAKAQAEAAVKEAEDMLQAAIDALEAAKKKGGVAHGAIWWMERSIEEKKKYMPGYKGPKK